MTKNKLIRLYSKDKTSLKRFVQLLNKINTKWKNLTFVVKPIKKKKKKVAVLKSPHVNKTAQTQFQAVTYSTLIKYFSWEEKKNYILLKKIRNHLFPDVKIQIQQSILVKKNKQVLTNQFAPKTLYYYASTRDLICKQKSKKRLLLDVNDNKHKQVLLKKTLRFMQVLDHFGNLN